MRKYRLASILLLIATLILLVWAITHQKNSQKSKSESEFPPTATLQPTVIPEYVRPSATPVPQQSGKITFRYELTNVIPKEFFGETYVSREIIEFKRQADNTWNTVQAKPVFMDLGPLFKVFRYESLSNVNGDCGVNTYPEEDDSNSPVTSFQPVCDTISNEEIVSITFGLKNCDRDYRNNLKCSFTSEAGTLNYLLNSKFNKFQFTFSGTWNFEYEGMITESLTKLGFESVDKHFFDKMVPGAGYTLHKSDE